MTGLLDWLDRPREDHGLRFAQADGSWHEYDYPRLAQLIAGAAVQLAERPRGVVSIIASNGPAFVTAFFGALVSGSTPSPLPPPTFGTDPDAYARRIGTILRAVAPVAVVVEPGLEEVGKRVATTAGLRAVPLTLDPVVADRAPSAARAPIALLQFTSGSTADPRGVPVTWEALAANIEMIRRWLDVGPDDATASWLPAYHDMGLIGCLLTPVVNQSSVWLMRPEQFVADPGRWIGLLGTGRASLTAAPNFGYGYVSRRVDEATLAALDFSGWRTAIAGAERLDPATLGDFARRLAPYGFRPEAIMPAYGLAEATLAVTGSARAEIPRAVRPDWGTARHGAPLAILQEARLDDRATVGSGGGWVLSCGRPHPRVELSVVDEQGCPLPAAHLGEIAVAGPTVPTGHILTGDAGFVIGDELFVVGRLGDSVKVRGRFVFAEDLEARLAEVEGIRRGSCVALAGSDGGRERIVVLVEAEHAAWAAAAAAAVGAAAGADVALELRLVPRGTIERTSSGKPRRRVLWQRLLDGQLGGEVVCSAP